MDEDQEVEDEQVKRISRTRYRIGSRRRRKWRIRNMIFYEDQDDEQK